MQLPLKNVSSLNKKSFFYLLIVVGYNFIYAQNTKFFIKNSNFIIVQNEKELYKTPFASGNCNDYQVNESMFNNQFYLYSENVCTTTTIKQLFKINWENNKFRILNKEIIKIKKGTIFCKNIFYENFIIDSLAINNLDVEEDDFVVNENKKINNISVTFNEKIIGHKKISSTDAIYNYPLIDNYNKIYDNISLYNDIAFILYKNKCFGESLFILKEVIKKSQDRIVAYLNIADCYWELNQKNEAKNAYQKYLSLMKSQNNDLKKIPKRVYKRIKT